MEEPPSVDDVPDDLELPNPDDEEFDSSDADVPLLLPPKLELLLLPNDDPDPLDNCVDFRPGANSPPRLPLPLPLRLNKPLSNSAM